MAIPAAGSALYAKLSGATAITSYVGTSPARIWDSLAPSETERPYIVFYLASGQMPNVVPRDTINWVFRIEAVGDTRANAQAVADAVFDTLHESSLTIPGWTNYWLVHERLTTMPDFENITERGEQRWRYIADYRVRASQND